MEFVENPKKLYKLVKQGALVQTTASSLIGHFGKKIKKCSLQLIEYKLTHVIASDAHNITTRTFHLQTGYNVIEKGFGIFVAGSFKENAYLALSGKEIYKEEPEMIRHKKLFSLFKNLIKLVMSSLPISMGALGHAVGKMYYLRRLSSKVWCEEGLDARIYYVTILVITEKEN